MLTTLSYEVWLDAGVFPDTPIDLLKCFPIDPHRRVGNRNRGTPTTLGSLVHHVPRAQEAYLGSKYSDWRQDHVSFGLRQTSRLVTQQILGHALLHRLLKATSKRVLCLTGLHLGWFEFAFGR